MTIKVKGFKLTDAQYIALLRLYSGCPLGSEAKEEDLDYVINNF